MQTCSCSPSVRYTSVAIYVDDGRRFAIGLEVEEEVGVKWKKNKSAAALIFAAEEINATVSA